MLTILPSRCSAVLVHRRVLATAAHCLYGADGRLETPTNAAFGEQSDAPVAVVGIDTCFLTRPDDGDVAVCVLKETAPRIPIIPVMTACESAFLEPALPAVEVGFGQATLDDDPGTKTWLDVSLVQTRSDRPFLEATAASQAGEYYGDSGGPLFFQMPDETWRVVGTDSGSPQIVAGSTAPRFSVYSNLSYFVDWAEEATGLDLTPCHDAGRWRPSEACAALPASRIQVADAWSAECGAEPTAVPRATCDEGIAATPDVQAEPSPSRARPFGGCSQAVPTRTEHSAHGMWVLLLAAFSHLAWSIGGKTRARERPPQTLAQTFRP